MTRGPRWTYGGRKVWVATQADIPLNFYHEPFCSYVQQVLNGIPLWEPDEVPIVETMNLPEGRQLALLVVPLLAHDSVIWALHTGHKAKEKQPAPFVIREQQPLTAALTVELQGTPRSPVLTRVMAGEYAPPLPWMASAKQALLPDGELGGKKYCWEFWQKHAYVARGNLMVGATKQKPAWWMQGNQRYAT